MRRLVVMLFLSNLLLSATAWSASALDVVINEVCWMGNNSSSDDEWVELRNNTDSVINLDGWKLIETEADSTHTITGCTPNCEIAPGGFFLIEKREQAVSDVTANLVINFTNGLTNSGENLQLKDDLDNIIDDLEMGTDDGWYEGVNGTGSSPDYSMERVNPTLDGNVSTNWADNDGVTINGLDSATSPFNATPGAENSTYDPSYDPFAPVIVQVHNASDTAIDIYFQTEVEETSAETITNYSISGVETSGATSTLDTTDATLVHLTGIPALTTDIASPYTISITGVLDATYNRPSDTSASFVAGVADISVIRTDGNTDSIPDIQVDNPNSFVTITGIVTDADNIDYRSTYLQDDTAGIVISDQETTDLLDPGDSIRVSCNPSKIFKGVFQLENCKAIVLAQGQFATPTVLTISQLIANPEQYESMLVYITGITKTNGTWPDAGDFVSLSITDDGGTSETILFIDSSTNLGIAQDGSWIEPSYPVDVVALAGQYSDNPTEGYQITPRDRDDFLPANNNTSCDGDNANCVGVFPNATGVCNSSDICEMGDCDQLKSDCNNAQLDGCEEDIGIATACSSCSDDCTTLQNATADPVTPCNIDDPDNPFCVYTCNDTFGDCDANLLNGCETQLEVDTNCSVCGDDCTDEAYANATGACNTDAEAICEYICDTGLGDCDNDLPTNGCEETLTDNLLHCGLCGNDCGVGNVSCVTNDCVCATGFADCDSSIGTGGDGCETPLGTATDCAACSDECAVLDNTQNQSCNTTDPDNPICDFECIGVFQDCNTDALDGCEAEIGTAQYCADCDDDCTSRANVADATCGVTNICEIVACVAHFGDCDDNQSNGCEVTLGTVTQCSTCTDACGDNGLCNISTETYVCDCVEGYADCNDDYALDGCEIELGVPQYCSACDDDCRDDFTNAEGLCTEGACIMGALQYGLCGL